MSEVDICQLTDSDIEIWNQYVDKSSDSTFFHLAQWKAIFDKVLGHRSYYLMAKIGEEVVGVFPLVQVKSKLFGNALISVPFGVYGGAIADDESIYTALSEQAVKLANELKVDYVEVREQQPSTVDSKDWKEKNLYVTFQKELLDTEEENFKAIPRKQRAVVRKAIDYGLTSEWDDNADRFYAMYSESVRNLGTPVLSKKYYQALLDTFGDKCRVLTILDKGAPVSSVLNFYFKDQVLPFYGGGPAQARVCKANDFMYWELMRLSVAQGIKVFDFGRSKDGAGSYRFKKHWGFTPEPLHYRFHLINAASMPDLSPVNPKYQLAIKTWKKLPLPVTHVVGPIIARNLG
ncbi:MAG: FemAB family XrtA/PEP-CTERM system-associated protein [Gammaproteobacteria bacterium]